MSPIEQAAAVYQREPCARTFREDLEAHLLHGLVMCTPTAFVMARYVRKDWTHEQIVNPWHKIHLTSAANCVHIYLAAGRLVEFGEFPHCPVSWVSFERGNKLRFHPYSKIFRKCTRPADPTSSLT